MNEAQETLPALSPGRAHKAPPINVDIQNNLPEKSQAIDLASGMLQSGAFHSSWSKFYRSRNISERNPIHQAVQHAADLKAGRLSPEEETVVLSFLREAVRIQMQALDKSLGKENFDITELRDDLDKLAGALSEAPAGQAMFPRDKIENEHYRDMLDVMEREGFQKPFTPMKTTWKFAKDFGGFIATNFKKHPVLSSIYSTFSVGLATLITVRLRNHTTDFIEPAPLGIRDYNFDEDGNVTDFKWEKPDLDAPVDLPSFQEFQTAFPELAPYLRDMGIDMDFIRHFSRLKDLTLKTNDMAYSFMNGLRSKTYDVFVTDPVAAAGDAAFKGTHFMDGFNWMGPHSSEFWYKLNMLENVSAHGLIALAVMLASVKAASMNGEEWKEVGHSISDHFSRAVHARPLTYVFSAVSACVPYAASGELGITMIWAAVAGGIAGHYGQKIWSRWKKNKEHVLEMTRGIRSSLHDFAGAAEGKAFSEQPVVEKKGGYVKAFTAVAGANIAATAVLLGADAGGAIDATVNESLRQALVYASAAEGAVANFLMTSAAFAHYNIPEDAVQHVGWVAVGEILAAPVVATILGYRGIKKLFGTEAAPLQKEEAFTPPYLHYHITSKENSLCEFDDCKTKVPEHGPV